MKVDFNDYDYILDSEGNDIPGFEAVGLAIAGHNPQLCKSKLLLADSHGIYIPQKFYNDFDFEFWGLNKEDYKELENPENDNYWETWQDLLENACHWKNDELWQLEQDGDLFARHYKTLTSEDVA